MLRRLGFALAIGFTISALPAAARSADGVATAYVGVAPAEAAPELAAETALVRAALLERLRFAFGEAAVADGAAPGAAAQVTMTLGRAFGQYDLALTVFDAATNTSRTEHFRFADPGRPATALRLVSLVDRALAPGARADDGPATIDLAPLDSTPALHDFAVSATALVAARLREASGATVTTRAPGDAAAPGAAAPRMVVTGAIGRSGSANELRLDAFAADRSALGTLQLLVRDAASFPATPVFAPFVTSALAAAPAPDAVAGPSDVTVLPFASVPELAEAAALARTALVDRMLAAGIQARAVGEPGPVRTASFGGTFVKAATGYRLDLVGRSASGGAFTSSAELTAPALVPPASAIVSLVEATKAASPAPEHRFVYVPFPNPSNKDGYINFANDQYGKDLAERGYALAAEPNLDPVDARLTAPELCKRDGADGILLGTHIDHDQEYHKGALRTAGSFLGFFTFGLANVAVNAINNVASDDRYVNRANVAATLVDCNGKRLWNKTVQGGNSHYGRNAAAGGSGAISDAIGQLVTSMFAETATLATPASPAKPVPAAAATANP